MLYMGTNARSADAATDALAAAIRAEMGRQDVKATQLARMSGIPESTLRKILKYGRVIDYEELRKIAIALRVRSSALVAEAESIQDSREE